MAVIQGAYSATWNGLSLGQTVSGYEMGYSNQARPVNFDSVGETPVDMLFSGAIVTVDMLLAEFDAAAVATLSWPWDPVRGVIPIAGTSLWQLAKPLVLTGCIENVNPATVTYPKAILAPAYNTRVLFSGTQPRYLPIQMYIFPISETNFSDGSPTITLPSGCSKSLFFVETTW